MQSVIRLCFCVLLGYTYVYKCLVKSLNKYNYYDMSQGKTVVLPF